MVGFTFLERVFDEKKTIALAKLQVAITENKVDIEVLDLIHTVNKFNQYYTTSSCAGRFVLLSKGSFRGKYTSHFVYKTHSPPLNKVEIQKALTQRFDSYLYINVEPPTFHIACKTLDDAINLHQLAIDSGIGYSMFKTIKKSIVVEIRGTGMLSIPVGLENKIFISDEYLDYIIKLSTEILSSEQARLKNFEKKLPNLAKKSV